MKNLAYLLFVMALFGAVLSCEKDKELQVGSAPTEEIENPNFDNELISGEENLLQALSQWVATREAKTWLQERANINTRSLRPVLNETLLLEVICGSEGQHFVDTYNAVADDRHSVNSFSDFLMTENSLLALKLDAYFDDFVGDFDRFTPLVSDQDRTVSFLGGERYDVRRKLEETGANFVIDFRLVTAQNTVLYDPGTNRFNRELPYDFCRDDIFSDRLRDLPDPICNGQIPLSITEHVQAIFYAACIGGTGGGFGNTGEICDNGIDDDDDGLIDCADPDCCGTEGCGACPEEICGNGIDDDGDGFVDDEDPDCVNDSPCMRDHYMDNNFFAELELVRPLVLAEMGGNLCGGVQPFDLYHEVNDTPNSTGIPIYPSEFQHLDGLEEWYNFHIKIHWGTPTGSDGIFQDLVYVTHLFELTNEPQFRIEIEFDFPFTVGVLYIEEQGFTETLPVDLQMVPFYSSSDVCGVNNWDPSIFGDLVAISIHEGDPCTLRISDGEITTTVVNRSYNSGFSLRFGLGQRTGNYNSSGGFLYNRNNSYASSETNQISSQYMTTFADDFYLGRVNYAYCWEDQGTTDQMHEMTFGNTVHLRILSQICE